MGLEPTPDPALREYWRPMELDFGQEALRHALRQLHAPLPDGEDGRHPERARGLRGVQGLRPLTTPCASAGIEALVKDIRAFAGYFCAMALGSEQDADAQARLPRPARAEGRCRLSVPAGAVPRLRQRSALSRGRLRCRRCGWSRLRVPPRHLRHPHQLDEQDLRDLRQGAQEGPLSREHPGALPLLPSYRRFPSDDEFRRDLQTRDLYNFRSRSYWLRRLENHGRKERVPVDEYTIEHILPQNENLSAAVEVRPRPGVGARPADMAAHARQPDAHRLQLRYSDRPSPRSAT